MNDVFLVPCGPTRQALDCQITISTDLIYSRGLVEGQIQGILSGLPIKLEDFQSFYMLYKWEHIWAWQKKSCNRREDGGWPKRKIDKRRLLMTIPFSERELCLFVGLLQSSIFGFQGRDNCRTPLFVQGPTSHLPAFAPDHEDNSHAYHYPPLPAYSTLVEDPCIETWNINCWTAKSVIIHHRRSGALEHRHSRNTTLIMPPMTDHSNTGLATRSTMKERPGVKENNDRSTAW